MAESKGLVTRSKPGPEGGAGGVVASVMQDQPWGRKSQAVLSLMPGMPGASGLANMRGPPMSALRAKEPGVVTLASCPGLAAPTRGMRCLTVGRVSCEPLPLRRAWAPLL